MQDQITRVEEWLVTTMKADATLNGLVGGRIYSGVTPPTQTIFPVIVFQWQASRPDTRGMGAIFVKSEFVYVIKAIAKDESYPRAVVDRLYTVLDRGFGTTPSGGTILSCVRETPLAMTEVDPSNTIYRHLGAQFRIQAM